MKSLLAVLVVMSIAGWAPHVAAAQIRTVPVQFKAGQNSAAIKGVIKGDQIVDYTLRAKAGQSMVVKFTPTHGAAYFNVMAPGQDTALHIGSTSGNDFSGALPATGTYTVRVYLMRSAARRNEQANYALEVGITGGAKTSDAAGAAPARVAGSAKWDAAGEVRCSAGSGTFDAQCGFRVVRNLARKSAEVWVANAANGKAGYRYLRFENQTFATDDGAKPSWQRQNDNWAVNVDAREFYLIPDALLLGG